MATIHSSRWWYNKITPWGTLRQFVDPKTNETITKFEDCSLEDYSFKLESIEKLYQTPNTPQSIYHNAGQDNIIHTPHNGNRNLSGLIISPESEVEGYVVDGYRQQQQQQHHNSSSSSINNFTNNAIVLCQNTKTILE